MSTDMQLWGLQVLTLGSVGWRVCGTIVASKDQGIIYLHGPLDLQPAPAGKPRGQ